MIRSNGKRTADQVQVQEYAKRVCIEFRSFNLDPLGLSRCCLSLITAKS